MSLIFSEGFDLYATASGTDILPLLSNHWDYTQDSGSVKIYDGRYTGSKSVLILGDGYDYTLFRKSVTIPDGGKLILGFNTKRFGSVSARQFRISLDASDPQQYYEFTGGFIKFYTGNIYTWVDDSDWHHIEFVFEDSENKVYLYIDGVLVHTKINFNSSFIVDKIEFSNNRDTTDRGYYLDDIYILDGSGTSANNIIGPTARIETLTPTSITSQADWVANTGNTYDAIGGIPWNDGLILTAASSGDISVFNFSNLQTSPSDINAISIRTRSADTDLVGTTFNLIEGATFPTIIGTGIDPSATFSENCQYFDVNPVSGSGWLTSTMDSIEIGVRSN